MTGKEKNTLRDDVYKNDEVDLFELWGVLIEHKVSIIFSALIVSLAAIIYVYSVDPTYESTAYVYPPQELSIQEANKFNELIDTEDSLSGERSYTAGMVFGQFVTNLSSPGLKKKILEKFDLLRLYTPDIENMQGEKRNARLNDALDSFSSSFSVQLVNAGEGHEQVAKVHFMSTLAPEMNAKIVNAAISLAEITTVNQIYQKIMYAYNLRLKQVNNKIHALRVIAKKNRQDNIVKLDEAIKVARRMGIKEPKQIGQVVNVNVEDASTKDSVPLYLLGYRLLEAQKKILETRHNDDSFINGFRKYEQRHTLLSSFEVDKNKIHVIGDSQLASPHYSAIKPKKKLVVIAAGFLGLFLGVGFVLIRTAYQNRKLLLE